MLSRVGVRTGVLAFVLVFCWLSGTAYADGCASDADCKAGRVCFQGACRDPASACATDRDCPGEAICESGRCVETHPAPPPAASGPASPVGPPDIAPAGSPPVSPPRPSDEGGPELAFQVNLGGGFQDRDDVGSGTGWVAGAGVGLRFESGIALLAIAGYASGSSRVTYVDGSTDSLPIRLSYAGAAVGFRSRAGQTMLGLAYARSPSFLGPVDEGMAFVAKGFYNIVGRFAIVLETTMAVVGEGRASTLSLGVGYAE